MEYTLKWSGRKDSEVVQLAFAYCKKEIPICKDVCEFINYDRYVELVTAGEIEEPRTYWKIEPGEVGMICYSSYAKDYARSWEDLSHCYRDFIAGYEACEAKYKYLRDWDEAIEHEAKRNAYLKKCRRSITFKVSDWEDPYKPLPNTTLYALRNGKWQFTISDNCTGPEFEYLVYSVCDDCRMPMPTLAPDPRRQETKSYR